MKGLTSKVALTIFLVFLHSNQIQSIELFEDILQFKEDLLNGIFGGFEEAKEGVFGKGKCGCPCRDYYVPKCEITYVEQCHYEHYEQVCESIPMPVVRQAKEIECQKCRKYKVPVPKTKWVKECNPVYDEKCKTTYHQHCKQETRCHMIYQTVCDNSGYQQHCESQPREHCYPETKCHRTPETQCVPVQKENCVKVPKESVEYVEEKQCLAFDLDAHALQNQYAGYDPCAGYQVPNAGYGQGGGGGHDHGHGHDVGHGGHGGHGSNGGYGGGQHGTHQDFTTVNIQHHNPTNQYNVPTAQGYQANFGDQYVQPTVTHQNHQVLPPPAPVPQFNPNINSYSVQDPILQHQPVGNVYEVKRESPNLTRAPLSTGNDHHNPFLRRPKRIRFNHRIDDDDGTKGWIPIPYPVFRK